MVDLVGTCPKDFWEEWLEEGDCAGSPETGQEYSWGTRSRIALKARVGDRFYVVAHGKLRGYAPIIWISPGTAGWDIIRAGHAIACTIEEPIPGFRGLRHRWWPVTDERSFPEWRIP
jgi:hypothetical protein